MEHEVTVPRTIFEALILVSLVLLAAGAAHAQPPGHVELSFEIRFGEMTLGKGEDVLKHDGKKYQVVSDTIPQGLAALFIDDIRRESRGSITANGLKPVSFIERGRKKGDRVAEFDWTNQELHLIHGGTNETISLPAGSIDQASLPYALAFTGSAPETFSVHLTDGRRLKEYTYRTVGREQIETVLGKLDTIHLEKVRDADSKRSFEFWLAIDHHYLPVRVRFTDKKGRAFDSLVTSIRYP